MISPFRIGLAHPRTEEFAFLYFSSLSLSFNFISYWTLSKSLWWSTSLSKFHERRPSLWCPRSSPESAKVSSPPSFLPSTRSQGFLKESERVAMDTNTQKREKNGQNGLHDVVSEGFTIVRIRPEWKAVYIEQNWSFDVSSSHFQVLHEVVEHWLLVFDVVAGILVNSVLYELSFFVKEVLLKWARSCVKRRLKWEKLRELCPRKAGSHRKIQRVLCFLPNSSKKCPCGVSCKCSSRSRIQEGARRGHGFCFGLGSELREFKEHFYLKGACK